MANYDGGIFEGHGKSEVDGSFDPGAVNGSVAEHSLVEQIVASAKKYLDPTGKNVHYDEQNFKDNDTSGNSYSSKSVISVHINSGVGASGVEIFVPMKESHLDSDFEIAKKIASKLNIPNRGVKSRDYDSENFLMRTNGQALNGRDYYGEIRRAWEQGTSLSILEVGFIQDDLSKIQANIDEVGFYVAEYMAKNMGVTVSKPQPAPQPTPQPGVIYRVVADGKQVGAYGIVDNAINKARECVVNGSKQVQINKG